MIGYPPTRSLSGWIISDFQLYGFASLAFLVGMVMVFGVAWAAPPSLQAWKPAFEPSGAKYKCIISNVSHPVLKGVYAGFAIRDELWKRTNGQIYIDYKPFSMLGGEYMGYK
jgi:hypothetical protein